MVITAVAVLLMVELKLQEALVAKVKMEAI